MTPSMGECWGVIQINMLVMATDLNITHFGTISHFHEHILILIAFS